MKTKIWAFKKMFIVDILILLVVGGFFPLKGTILLITLILFKYTYLFFTFKPSEFLATLKQRVDNNANRIAEVQDYAKYLGLQYQINPHFLYNTLEGIRSECLMSGLDSISDMTHLLAEYFRYNISDIDKLVTIEEELTNIETYFKIQKFRFAERIDMEIIYEDCDDLVINSCLIPKLILQPIVENAIQHGIEPIIHKGHLAIRFRAYKNRLMIVISDNGVGIPPAELSFLNEKMSPTYLPENKELKESIGLVNVNQRIKYLYGDDFGLFFYSKLGFGTDAEIEMPLKMSQEKNQRGSS